MFEKRDLVFTLKVRGEQNNEENKTKNLGRNNRKMLDIGFKIKKTHFSKDDEITTAAHCGDNNHK